jgi:tetratricopeptide (TPR) repeat protein
VKKFFQRWSRNAPFTLFVLFLTVVGAFIANLISPFDNSMFFSVMVIELIILGYSFFYTAWNGSETAPNYDKRIIKNTFDGPGSHARLFRRSYKSLIEGDIATALEGFNLLKESKLHGREKAVLFFYIGRCYQFMGYPTNAARSFRTSIDEGIGIDEVYTLCGREMVSCGDFSSAETVYNELIEKSAVCAAQTPEFVYTDIGMLYIKANDPDKALETFSYAIKHHLNYAFALGGCAIAYILKNDSKNAKFFYSQAVLNNIDDLDGFTEYYVSVAETQGLSDEIGIKPRQKVFFDPSQLGQMVNSND